MGFSGDLPPGFLARVQETLGERAPQLVKNLEAVLPIALKQPEGSVSIDVEREKVNLEVKISIKGTQSMF